jgi:hypothetical protein
MGENMRHWIGGRDAHIQAIEPGPSQGRLIDATVVVLPNPDHPYGQNIRTHLPTGSTLYSSL